MYNNPLFRIAFTCILLMVFASASAIDTVGTTSEKIGTLQTLNFSDAVVTLNDGSSYQIDPGYLAELQTTLVKQPDALKPGMMVRLHILTLPATGGGIAMKVVTKIQPIISRSTPGE
ncbi:MAG: hypothetical protein P8Y64_12860 [Gammaproteobacteria bacterium]